MKPQNKKWEVINHGVDFPDYFPGYGICYTDYDQISIGIGGNAKEAYNDAVDSIAQIVTEKEFEDLKLPRRPKGIRVKDKVPREDLDAGGAWYVVILF